eukprot:TRINITY_DN2827_c0_g1_i1.p1 TRINITY_DN2827_c0_g1~~TRINITY_DN2827_c0_g1_i1.p1  ORF type:complete len:308 (-),score=46.97 TRINITY_DN2827_c0_g1_i1:95-991(-)
MGYEDDKPSFTSLVDDPPTLTLFWWICGGVIALINFILCAQLIDLHSQAPPSKRRKYSLRIVMAIPVFSCYAYLTLYFVKGADIMAIIQKWYQGVLMFCFYGWIMTWFTKPYTPITEQSPSDYFVSLPFCCCGWFFCARTGISVNKLRLVKYGMIQLGISQMLLTIFGVILDINGKYESGAYVLVKILSLISMMIAVYSLNTLVKMTQNLLPSLNIYDKSRGILFLIAIVNIQEALFTILGQTGAYTDTDGYNSETKAQMWSSFILIIDCLIYALIIRKAWKLEDSSHEVQHGYNIMA